MPGGVLSGACDNHAPLPISSQMPSSVSIAVCTYNGERFLQEQLDSLLAQTRRPDQIVIRDDVSSDGTLALLRAFVPRAEAEGIAVDLQVNPQNLGYRGNFDGALRACTGEVIFLCDQDDVWHADKLARFCAQFDARPGLLALHCDAQLIDEAGESLPQRLFAALRYLPSEQARMHDGDGFRLMLKRNLMTGAAMAFRHSVLADALPLPDKDWVHDAWIGTLAAMRGEIDSLPDALIGYRLHSNNQLGLGGNDTAPRAVRRKRQLETERVQSALLLARGRTRGLPEPLLAWVERKQDHVSVRATLPSSRLRRLPAVMGELFAGNYSRFGRGLLSAGIDLVRA
ncbi:glycosyltransferase family 2 protein [Stenotrophomonas maltophilia]|uniref:glycosyltransferase family 2 protein n=1 Tax=Stenotrophomonas maltophilia TaxID=40324 RepID=UPI0039F65458